VPAVARGSHEPSRFITLRWAPADAAKHVAIVGKAITFDSGGLSLKPAKSMETMKYDMAGGRRPPRPRPAPIVAVGRRDREPPGRRAQSRAT
jgi:hypothetical protein